MRNRVLVVVAVTAAIVLGGIVPAIAACRLNGVAYPTGTRIGPYICRPNGTWGR